MRRLGYEASDGEDETGPETENKTAVKHGVSAIRPENRGPAR